MEQLLNVPFLMENRNGEYNYKGNLMHYAKVIFYAPNIANHYHGLRHMYHVMWDAYRAAIAMGLDPLTIRLMLIASLFHDYNHPGKAGNDADNLKLAIKGLRTHIHPSDEEHIDTIILFMMATEYPHKNLDPHGHEFTLPALLVRDADISYTLGAVWISTVSGLAWELSMSALELIKLQETFLKEHLHFSTEWGKSTYDELRVQRIEEVQSLIRCLS